MLLEPTTAQAVAVALHELATNAAKYGSLSVDGGKVVLKWSQELDGQLKLRWTESGGPPVQAPTRKGFGGRIIQQMITQLKGTAHFDWQPEGTCLRNRASGLTGMSDYLFFAGWLAVAITLSFALIYAWNSVERWSSRRSQSPH